MKNLDIGKIIEMLNCYPLKSLTGFNGTAKMHIVEYFTELPLPMQQHSTNASWLQMYNVYEQIDLKDINNK